MRVVFSYYSPEEYLVQVLADEETGLCFQFTFRLLEDRERIPPLKDIVAWCLTKGQPAPFTRQQLDDAQQEAVKEVYKQLTHRQYFSNYCQPY